MNAKSKRINEQELILEQNETFKLLFDMPTPRAHFIILFNNIQEKHNFYKTSVKFLEDSDLYALFDLIDKFRARTGNNLGDIILSFHTGGWATCNYFHAHICVDTDAYLQYVSKTDFRKVHFNPTRNWKIRDSKLNLKELYIENVKNYELLNKIKVKRYQTTEIQTIKKSNSNQATDFNRFTINCENACGCDIFFDMSKPHIQFILNNKSDLRSNQQKYVQLIQIMKNFANNLNLFSVQTGSHICLNIPSYHEIDSDDSIHEINEINDNQLVDGYIRMSGNDFFYLHPLRNSFLENFEKNTNYRINT